MVGFLSTHTQRLLYRGWPGQVPAATATFVVGRKGGEKNADLRTPILTHESFLQFGQTGIGPNVPLALRMGQQLLILAGEPREEFSSLSSPLRAPIATGNSPPGGRTRARQGKGHSGTRILRRVEAWRANSHGGEGNM
ncbi:hypothetical protein R1flu_019433 [Riccia fluitans]|uniref:Uncharacterized protein n=1 Tax=Riccia fluitans TaxID=41844 RepID=A0ABD1ZK41_9MARC